MKVAQSALETLGAAREDTGLGGYGTLDLGARAHDLMVAVRSTRRFSVYFRLLSTGRG